MTDINDVLYRRDGDNFYPVGIDASKLNLGDGQYQITVTTKGNSISVLQEDLDIESAAVGVRDALKDFRETVTKAMHEASKLRPYKRMPARFMKAYAKMCSELGDDVPAMFEYATIEEIVCRGIAAMIPDEDNTF